MEIILGIRKLGGQILKNDKQSDYEIIERGLLNDEVASKRDRRMSLGLYILFHSIFYLISGIEFCNV